MITFLVHHGTSGPFLHLNLKQTYCSQVFPSSPAFLSLQQQEMVFPSASLYTEPSPAMDLILAHLNLKLSSAFISPQPLEKSPPLPPCRHLKYFSYYYVFKPGCFFSGVFFCKRQLCIKHPLDLHVTENFNFTPVCPVFPGLTEMQGEAAGKCLLQLCLQPWGCKQNHLKIFETFSL